VWLSDLRPGLGLPPLVSGSLPESGSSLGTFPSWKGCGLLGQRRAVLGCYRQPQGKREQQALRLRIEGSEESLGVARVSEATWVGVWGSQHTFEESRIGVEEKWVIYLGNWEVVLHLTGPTCPKSL